MFLPFESATRRERRFARIALVVSVAVFLAAVPFAKTDLGPLPAFIPIYVAVLVICDLITSALLFGQYSVVRSVPMLVLAGAYLFTATVTFAYALIFPGLLPMSPAGLGGPQTTSAMYMFWHAGFPLMLMGYTALRQRPTSQLDAPRTSLRKPILGMIAAVLLLVIAFTLFAVYGHSYIPEFLVDNHTTALGRAVLVAVWLLSLLALLLLWRKARPPTVLDIWLQVVLCVWLFDIALAALLNAGRYDLGWYTGRIYGLIAASVLLITLVSETARQYRALLATSGDLRRANAELAQLSRFDSLTSLANRRHFDEYLKEQIALARRQHSSLALALLDVDHFKAYNDHAGHQAGDVALIRIASALNTSCRRPSDMAARYGGEEFAMILPETDAHGAELVAEAARMEVAQLHIPHANSSTGPHVTISVGIALLRPDSGGDAQDLLAAADQALYQAKHAGRNRVCIHKA